MNVSARNRTSDLKEISIEINKDGWGYTNLSVRCEGGFVFTETKALSAADFSGNICPLKLFVDPSACAPGLHPGKVILFNSYTELEIPVWLSVDRGVGSSKTQRARKNLSIRVTDCYISSMLGLTSGSAFIAEMGRLIDQMLTLDEYDITAKLM